MNVGSIRDGAAHLPALIEGDRAYRLDDLLGAMGGVPVTVPDDADAAGGRAICSVEIPEIGMIANRIVAEVSAA